jgi:glycopeptide antibiotics resistance protein
MGGFRRFVIAVGDIAALLGIIVVTLMGVVVGSATELLQTYFSSEWFHDNPQYTDITGALVGGMLGFLAASIIASVLFALSEIASNSRQTVLALERIVTWQNEAYQNDGTRESPT